MKTESILIVDDSHDMLEVLRRQLTDMGYYTFQASNVVDAVDVLKTSGVDLLITDLQMPGANGIQLVKYASEHYPELPTLVITGYPSVENAVNAVRSGAMDYLVKPFTKDELSKAIDKSLFTRRNISSANSVKAMESTLSGQDQFYGIIGRSQSLAKVIDVIERIKNNRVTALINGESGTGKELVARAIHYSGKFSKSPFIPVNCGGIPEDLLESELFGYTKGAFTGADSNRAGFFQAADGGTIFLDEIGNASLKVQLRLLRVLQEKEVTMIGSQKTRKINIRIIAATNSNLLALTKSGRFREDLYYRLNVVNIEVPPLRKRKEDIPLLANSFVRKFGQEFQKTGIRITDKAMEILMRYHWPGNIRELENTIQRSLIMADKEITIVELPDYLKLPQPEDNLNELTMETLAEVEKRHILKILHAVDNNKTKAAEILGIDRKTLRQKIMNNN